MNQTLPALRRPSRRDQRLLRPGDASYEEARKVWNAAVDRRPALIFRCGDVEDIRAAIRRGREEALEIGVRCGGHNIAGLAVPEGGLMIDLRPMNRVVVDPVRRRATVQGGALLGALDRATQPHGLATTAGNVSHTGIGGLALGGGMGWLARRCGLTCDNVIGCTLVTAAGEVLRVDAERHPEVFWALRGGGGNFGVVVEFELRLHAVGTRALSVNVCYTAASEAAAEAMAGWRELALAAPREATFTVELNGDEVRLGYVWVGDPARGARLRSALHTLGPHREERIEELSYVALQTREDSVQGHAVRRYWKSHYLPGLPDEAIVALLAERDGSSPNVSLQTYGGAIADVDDADSAFSHRHACFAYAATAGWTDPAADETQTRATRAAAARIEPFASGVYVNALSDEGAGGIGRAYSDSKRARLTAVKDAYDPDNVFHLNHNISPSRGPELASAAVAVAADRLTSAKPLQPTAHA